MTFKELEIFNNKNEEDLNSVYYNGEELLTKEYNVDTMRQHVIDDLNAILRETLSTQDLHSRELFEGIDKIETIEENHIVESRIAKLNFELCLRRREIYLTEKEFENTVEKAFIEVDNNIDFKEVLSINEVSQLLSLVGGGMSLRTYKDPIKYDTIGYCYQQDIETEKHKHLTVNLHKNKETNSFDLNINVKIPTNRVRQFDRELLKPIYPD
jgi:hypothetical protein